jgi:hypothetical protein
MKALAPRTSRSCATICGIEIAASTSTNGRTAEGLRAGSDGRGRASGSTRRMDPLAGAVSLGSAIAPPATIPSRRPRRVSHQPHASPARLSSPPRGDGLSSDHGLQVAGSVEVFGLMHRGPNPVASAGRLIIANGPASCSPLNGVGLFTLKPQLAASLGSLNQKPT